MIRKIKFSNFYSFKGIHEIDFTTNKKKSDNYFNTFDGKQISKVALIVGPNNSGKTNLMKLFGYLDYFMSTPTRENKDFGLGFKQYAFCTKKPTTFELEFETENKLYLYKLKTSSDAVLEESLSAKKLTKKSRLYKIFERKGNIIIVNKNVISGTTQKSLSSVKDNVSTVAFLNSGHDIEEIEEISNYFYGFRTNINERGDVGQIHSDVHFAIKGYDLHPDIKEKMEDLIHDFNIDVEGFNIEKDKENSKITVNAVHKVEGETFILPLSYESRGTQALFAGLYDILVSIEDGTVLALDEIETGLHPQAVYKLVSFIVDEFSEKKRQFIFSSHSFEFIKKLDPQQIFLVEKKDNSSFFFRLDELKVRPDENFLSKYMSGAYGAFPRIGI